MRFSVLAGGLRTCHVRKRPQTEPTQASQAKQHPSIMIMAYYEKYYQCKKLKLAIERLNYFLATFESDTISTVSISKFFD